jgi:GTP cyclohydrolase I
VSHLERALELLGVRANDTETDRTPERVAELYRQLFRGLDPSAAPVPSLSPHAGTGLVVVTQLPFYSMCAHHLLPFFGHAAVGYLPRGQVVGLGAIADTVDYFAARPQLQERLTEDIAGFLDDKLGSRGLIVHLRARHMCVEMRGPRRPSFVETTAARGELVDGPLRGEFLRRVGA